MWQLKKRRTPAVLLTRLRHRKSRKAGLIECEYRSDSMHVHGGNEPRVMSGLAGDSVTDDQFLPDRIDGRSFRHEFKDAFNSRQFGLGGKCRHSESVLRDGSCCDHPKLDQVLCYDLQALSPLWKDLDDPQHTRILRVVNLRRPKQNASVDEQASSKCFPGSCPRQTRPANSGHGFRPTRGTA